MKDIIIGTINPGYGENSIWSFSSNKHVTVDAMLLLSKIEKEEFESTGKFIIYLTRNNNVKGSSNNNTLEVVNSNSDFFISNYLDAEPASSGGTTVYYSTDLPSDKPIAEKLAASISGTLGIFDKGAVYKKSSIYAREEYFKAVEYARSIGIPHIFLFEYEFHTNPSEIAILNNIDYLRKIAKAKVGTICEYYGVPYPSTVNNNTFKKKIGVITAVILNSREKPSILSSKNGKIKKGTVVTIYNEINGWYLINSHTPQWVHSRYVRIV